MTQFFNSIRYTTGIPRSLQVCLRKENLDGLAADRNSKIRLGHGHWCLEMVREWIDNMRGPAIVAPT